MMTRVTYEQGIGQHADAAGLHQRGRLGPEPADPPAWMAPGAGAARTQQQKSQAVVTCVSDHDGRRCAGQVLGGCDRLQCFSGRGERHLAEGRRCAKLGRARPTITLPRLVLGIHRRCNVNGHSYGVLASRPVAASSRQRCLAGGAVLQRMHPAARGTAPVSGVASNSIFFL